MRYIAICLFLLYNSIVLAQGNTQGQVTAIDLEFDRAKVFFLNKKYNTAAIMFKKVYDKVKDEEKKAEVLFMIAESYRLSNNFKKAFDWYEQLVNTKYPDPKILYSYGLLLKNFERYDDAARMFNDYLFEVPGDKNAEREIKACRIAAAWKLTPLKFTVANVKQINTTFSDYSPCFVSNKLFWSSSRSESTGGIIFEWTGQKCSDLFESELTSLAKVNKLPGLVNTNYNEGVIWMDSVKSTMYYTQCNGADGRGMNCKIYVSYYQNNQWTEGKVLPFCTDSFTVGHPSFSDDGKRLFFASDMPGGYGEKDIYVISYNSLTEKWGTPINLGPNVNTNEDEMFPALNRDGKIYFASKGHYGFGGLDLFYTKDSANSFSKAINLQSPINSGADDFGITFTYDADIQKPIAYYSSNREGGIGDDDIYSISIKPFTYLVKGIIIDNESKTPAANATMNVTGTAINQQIKTGTNGEFTLELPLNEEVQFFATKEKYFRSNSIIVSSKNTVADTTANLTLLIEPIPDEGVEFTLKGIYYDLDKADIRPEAAKILDSLVVILNQNPTLVIELASHTDSRADENYNVKLSQRRAQSCVDYLIKNGIDKKRLVAVGYGESKLVNDCADGVDCTDEQHQENRRTTFRVIADNFKSR
ncbi:MAG: OmpA family protein [Bacteroidia bacterium]|jgi:outer membrane protein OmpA-like peptidoglycan-associated protein|nr:OmpA family protein [Bacteroidia bacterium]